MSVVCKRQDTAEGYQGQGHQVQTVFLRINNGAAGVGVMVAEEWIEKVFEIRLVSDRIILLKMIVGQCVITFLSVYTPQCGLSEANKDLFYDQLRAVTSKIPASEFLTPCSDWIGHVGRSSTGFREEH